MKRILYDMGPLTLVRWLLQRALKFGPPFGPRSKMKRVPPPSKNWKKNKCVLDWLLGKIQCFKTMLLFVFFLVENSPSQTPPPLWNFQLFFFNPSLICWFRHSQCLHFNFRTKKCEIQTKSGPKFSEKQTKSGPNLTISRTGFTKTGLIRTLSQ